MKNVAVLDIKNGRSKNYPHIISLDERFIFSCSNQLENYQEGGHIFYTCKYRNKAFYAEIMSGKIMTRYDFLLDEWIFEYEEHKYIAREGDVLVPLCILIQKEIPPDWSWRRPLGTSKSYSLWHIGIERPLARIARVNDLLRIFRKGPAFDLLEKCKKQLEHTSTDGRIVTIYEPAPESTKAQGAVVF